ncbi:CPBP family intramembrane glutamic endopeptidase [Stenotrophomonas rhizophila]|uniref:CPBP family intramembrane glutamic endopeptidase n=1 Tax=Stenotrophomonas rhizophila TaxID=216778 RepID=UPI001E2F6544|nr:CPBP family intramembrane glutamic endopeptidase [Stenotrophomonas rhizophila]MCC7635183.1 CPBP family intramembrane metalloprotease [Stenotrophomonas rhizophila]MCC7664602.1 CPBP family intramembrane metalloprotease [Stenotrophomonas rhizophila]
MLNVITDRLPRFMPAFRFAAAMGLSITMVFAVSMALMVASMIGGVRSMDLTFKIAEPAGKPGVRDGSAVYGTDARHGITCADASAAMGDGHWWIRCKFAAEESAFGTDYLESRGLTWDGAAANVVIRPIGGAWVHYLVAALLALILGLAWSWRDRQRWRRELQWIWAHRKTAVVALLLPAAAAFSLSTVTYLLTGAAAMPPAMANAVPREYLLPMFIAIVVVAPVLEELLHRGVVFDLLSRRVGVIAAAGLGTALFVGMHFLGESGNVEPIRLVSLVTFSLAIYAVRVRCNSLVLCVLAHMLLNLIVFAAIALGTQA